MKRTGLHSLLRKHFAKKAKCKSNSRNGSFFDGQVSHLILTQQSSFPFTEGKTEAEKPTSKQQVKVAAVKVEQNTSRMSTDYTLSSKCKKKNHAKYLQQPLM